MKPARIVPNHGMIDDAELIADQRTMMRAIQARAVELKREGKSADDTARTVQMEFQTKYPDWMGAAQPGNAARTAYQEAP